MTHTIELKKVSKYYANENSVSMGFARLDLKLDMGEFVAITGESGSGKSTLLNVISGLDNYDEGEMFVCGEDTTAYKTEDYERYRKTYIGNIFQDFNLVNSYSVYQNVEMVMLMCGKKASECKERITQLLELVGLTEYAKTKASKLSGGQKQRVAIARALAKDAPIIVADEPTGNLDSESAKIVMDTLSVISKNKLVVIVTHNYEQAEPYVTRKITMHDGRIIEDKYISHAGEKTAEGADDGRVPDREAVAEAGADSGAYTDEGVVSGENRDAGESLDEGADLDSIKDDMLLGSQLRLGIRNTFNLPSKFLLLFIVYFFVSSAIISQYASVKNNLHQREILGYSGQFVETSAKRAIISKSDGSAFTDDEIAWIAKQSNVDTIAKNDVSLDYPFDLYYGDTMTSATAAPVSQLKKSMLSMGRMPEADNEIVIYTTKNSITQQSIEDIGDSIIGMKASFMDFYGTGTRVVPDDAIIVGVVFDDSAEGMNWSGYDKIYVSDAIANELLVSAMSTLSKTTLDYNGTKQNFESGYAVVYSNANVPAGQVYIPEEMTGMYENSEAMNKPLSITVENARFTQSVSLKVGKVITKNNVEKSLGISKGNYELITSYVYVNPSDFASLYDRGNYQISVFMNDENKADALESTLNSKGYECLFIKDVLSDITGGFSFVLELLSMGALIIEFIILFYIAYAVIKLIMKSRNSYYSTLRILGASRRNTNTILRVELLAMMLIACAVDMILVVLINNSIIDATSLKNQLSYLKPLDYVVLVVLLITMSLLIAKRYSRKIFGKSAMNVYREEA